HAVVDIDDDVLDPRVRGDRPHGVRAIPAVLPIEAPARRPVRIAEGRLAIAPAEEHRPRDRAAADVAAAVVPLVVLGLGGRRRPVIRPGHGPTSGDRSGLGVRAFDGVSRVTTKNCNVSVSPLAYARW